MEGEKEKGKKVYMIWIPKDKLFNFTIYHLEVEYKFNKVTKSLFISLCTNVHLYWMSFKSLTMTKTIYKELQTKTEINVYKGIF